MIPKKLQELGLKSWKEYKAWRKLNPKPPIEHFNRLGIFKVEDVLPFIGGWRKDYLEQSVNMSSQRYQLFHEKGCTCVKCGLVGTYFALERPNAVNKKGKLYTELYHFNLYGLDENGDEVLFTKDHIIPKSKGGKSSIENYQPMCYNCNHEKGNKEEVEEEVTPQLEQVVQI